ncbi:MAG: MFS transporter, partial [Chloroflexi bacterium]|nr:MFS transporter [Chloroflexota bacterium]
MVGAGSPRPYAISMADPLAVPAKIGARAPRGPSLAQTFAAFKHRNYRLWFLGQLTSLSGTWMQNVAQPWLVYDLTKSPLYLGIVSFASALPTLTFSLWAGVLIDRVPKRQLLLITQVVMMCTAFLLAADVFLGWVQPWHIVLFALINGTAQAFDAPTRQAFTIEMVGRADLMNAIALNSAMFNSARILGPTIAGIVLALLGPAWCFFLNGISFLAVIGALLTMQMPRVIPKPRTDSPLMQLREGLSYIRHHQTIRSLILLAAVSNLFAMGYSALIPAFARDVFDPRNEIARVQNALAFSPALQHAFDAFAQSLARSEIRQSLLMTFVGMGALAGALVLAALGNFQRKGMLLTAGNLLFPVMVLGFAFANSFFLGLIILFLAGLGFMVQNGTVNTLIQMIVPDELRGRVMSVHTLVFMGFFPIGALIAGAIAQRFGIPVGAAFGGAIALAFSL